MVHFKTIIECIDKALNDARIHKSTIGKFVLNGVSTKIPKLRQMICSYFDDDSVSDSSSKLFSSKIDSGFDVVKDAAIMYAGLLGLDSKGSGIYEQLWLNEANPSCLDVEVAGGTMHGLIERNKCAPCRGYDTFTTDVDNQPGILVEIFAGEAELCKDNYLIGKFEMMGLGDALRGVPQIEVTLEMDVNGILSLRGCDKK